MPYTAGLDKIKAKNPKGIIFTGGPNSVYDPKSPTCTKEYFELGVPVLGICYGSQLMCHINGGTVETADISEFGKTEVNVDTSSLLFKGIDEKSVCWMSHTDAMKKVPDGFRISATTAECPIAAMENADKKLYAVQFHPEVEHTTFGREILRNFLYNVCGVSGDWKMDEFVRKSISALKEKIGDKKVLCALSGGVDSSVAAVLIHKAVGKQLTCIFVDHGLLRKNEGDEVEKIFSEQFDMNLVRVNAQDRFLDKLAA